MVTLKFKLMLKRDWPLWMYLFRKCTCPICNANPCTHRSKSSIISGDTNSDRTKKAHDKRKQFYKQIKQYLLIPILKLFENINN